MRSIKCAMCGVTVAPTSSNQRYCKPCGITAHRERRNKRERENYQHKSPIISCEVCGVLTERNSNRQRYCKLCSEVVRSTTNKEWFKDHPTYRNDWYLSHKEEASIKAHLSYVKNPDAVYARLHKRRARIRGNGGSYTPKELREQFAAQDYCCYYCHTPFFNGKLEIRFHVDHKVPVSQGGSSYISNIAIACPKCNLEKGTMTEDEFISSRAR